MIAPLFAHLAPDQVRQLAERHPAARYPAGAVLAWRGQPADLIVLDSGSLVATVETRAGQRIRLGDHTGPGALDKAAVLDGHGHSATWTATAPTVARRIPAAVFRGLLTRHAELQHHVFRVLSEQLRTQQQHIINAHTADARTRVARWLLRESAGTGRTIRLPGAQQGLADTVGASRVTVNRALRDLVRAGAISVTPGSVTILDPAALAAAGTG